MIINTTPENIAVLGNVSNVGEFRIKNSAKAFAILSSGLYANKIRAIIRELSCNAYDSHVAALKKEVPFDLHLPTTFEPYFYIRDYGTGLTHDQVINIYTTYFESTKTNSNDFIGALGLGSKSPFSYTDNFTVTAIKDGIKGIYSAFINEMGVPSVALMSSSETDEPNGVEVKFAVDVKSDFSKFKNEAQEVLIYFPTKPNMTGGECNVRQIKYSEIDVVPGINVIDNTNSESIAIMGNIAYPIDVPNEESNLGYLADLLNKSLEIRFDIGDLEFQASREGLSYTKSTIEAIKAKLQLLQDKLDGILFKEADSYGNLWERADFLVQKYKVNLWKNSVKNYVRNNDVKNLIEVSSWSVNYNRIEFSDEELANDYNIRLTGFISPSWSGERISQIRKEKVYSNTARAYQERWNVNIGTRSNFVKYEKYRGGLEHVKYHYNTKIPNNGSQKYVYILSPAKADLPVLYDKFLKNIYNPPSKYVIEMADLVEKPKVDRVKYEYVITALSLVESNYNRNTENYVWNPVDDITKLDDTKTYYYIPLSGYTPISKDGYIVEDVKELFYSIQRCGISSLTSINTIYGIRKSDMEKVEKMKNWINIQDHLISVISKVDVNSLIGSYAKRTLHSNVFNNMNDVLKFVDDKDCLYVTFMNHCKNVVSMDVSSLDSICKIYGGNITSNTFMEKIKNEISDFRKKYPLLENLDYRAKPSDIAFYINAMNKLN